MGRIIGIDLGTTNSAVAVWNRDAPQLIPNRQGGRLTPSVVSFDESGPTHVGDVARREAVAHASSTIHSAKRFIGRSFDMVTADREDMPYEVVPGEYREARFLVEGQRWSPEQVAAAVLREIKEAAEAFLGEPVDGAVITTPAHFNDAQRAATREAGRLAGLDVRRILNEPTAAALAYGRDKMLEVEKIVVVYDFGGGTFDVSVLSVGEDIIQVIATAGDAHLGGDMIDTRLCDWLLAEFQARAGFPADQDAATLQRLRDAAEAAKIGLSTQETVEIEIPFPNEDNPSRLNLSLTRADFERMMGDLVDRTLVCCGRALSDAGKLPSEIDQIVLAGGSTRIPLVRQKVAEHFGKSPLHSVDPDVVVAMGAAVQAGIIAGDLRGVILVDVTSLSLGIEIHDGRRSVVIPRNTAIPTSETSRFATSYDDQTMVEFHVVQGEAERAENNATLGRFQLDGLRPAPAATSPIEVTFAIDIDGMVIVSAHDLASGREHNVTISVDPTIGRQKSSTPATPSSAATEAAPVSNEGLNLLPAVAATLDEANELLAIAGPKMSRVDRASLMKNVSHLRGLAASNAPAEETERSRAALAKVCVRVKTVKPARPRD